MVPLSTVKQHGVTLRKVNKESDEYKINVLGSMRDNGQRTPIALCAKEGADGSVNHPTGYIIEDGPHAGKVAIFDEITLIDGGHRTTAAEDLVAEGREEFQWLRAEYNGIVTKNRRLIAQVQFNKNKVETTPGEIAEQCARILITNPGWTQEKLAKELSMNKGTLSQVLKINRLPEFARKACAAGEITAQNAINLAKLPLDLVDESWVEKAKTMTTNDFGTEVDNAKEAEKKRKRGEAKPGEFVPPMPRLRKSKEILELWGKDDGRAERLAEHGLDEPTMRWLLQQDDATIRAAKVKFEEGQSKKRQNKALEHVRRSVGTFGLNLDFKGKDKDLTVEQIISLVEQSDRPNAAEGADALRTFVATLMAGGMADESNAKPEGEAPTK